MIFYPREMPKTQKNHITPLKWLKKIIEAKNLHVSFEYCFEELKGVLRKPNESNEKENSLAKHKVTYESIFKEKRGIDILSDAVFHEGDEVFEVVSVMLHNELIHLRTTFVLCVI